ncbi:PKD domain-containing protein [Methanospirillum stamsii]|nr:PKD domain-containing protein [Methanospirillum stamsii]
MNKLWGWVLVILTIISMVITLSAADSLTIYPDVLYQDMPVVIEYTGFTDGESIVADFDLSFITESDTKSGITDGFILYPFTTDDGKISAFSGDLVVNGAAVPSNVYSDFSNGLLSLSLAQESNAAGESGNVAFRFSGVKTTGVDSGSINFIPELSPGQGVMNVTVTIGDKTVSKQIPYETDMSNPEISSQDLTDDQQFTEYGIMHQTPEQMREELMEMLNSEALPNAPVTQDKDSKSLLVNVPYVPSERNQGTCGNCWAWASTGVIETAHTVQNGVKDRLSIQYVNSNLNNGVGDNWACEGGSASKFVDFYSNPLYDQVIPWSNTNASYHDANACPGGDCSAGTKMPAQYIATNPNYPITSISSYLVPTYTVTQDQAIANLKAQIDANKALYYGFRLPTIEAWSEFSDFWRDQAESVIWDPDPYNGAATDAGGHGVLLVGYNDTSSNPDERYWEVLNSWGSNANRPNGIFRLKMNMNYAGSGIYWNNYFYAIEVAYTPGEGYTLDVQSDEIGWINPSGTVEVAKGASQTFTFNPTAGARVKNLTVDGTPVTYNSDLTYTLQNVQKDYTIRLNNEPLPGVVIAAFAAESGGGNSVKFSDKSLGDANKWKWDFGDGTTSSEQSPLHPYAQAGTYTVSLWARSDLSQSQVVKGSIEVPMKEGYTFSNV